MDAELDERLCYELMLLEQQRKDYALRLEKLQDCTNLLLKRMERNGHSYYYIKRPGSDSYNYINRSSDEISRIRETRYLEESISRIDNNIELVRSLKDDYLPLDMSHVNERLPYAYRGEVVPVSDMYREISDKWLARELELQKEFPENYPQYKKHRTSDEIMVKTISELVIYERFKAAGLTQIYELPFLPSDHGPAVYPDFSVLSPIDMESVIFVEFARRMDIHGYREDFARKVGRYIDSGYIPGVNLFFIFSDKDGNVDSLQITKVIADIYGLRDPKVS